MSDTLAIDDAIGQPALVSLDPIRARWQQTGHTGMVIFLGSWTMAFAALFFVHTMYRLRWPVWPPPGFERLPIELPGFNTLLIVLSSVMLHIGLRSLDQGRLVKWRRLLLATVAMGTAFLALQFVAWFDIYAAGLHWSHGAYAAFFYFLTLFHAVHVLVGIGLLGWLVPQATAPRFSFVRASRARLVAMFWHFVDVAWLITFLLVYVL